MKSVSNVIMKLIGIILITAAILKGYQLLTEPTVEVTIWSQRWFLILQVEFELFLGIWLVSGIMKRAAWLAALSCFVLFSGVTLYKGITGADSCGCFGSVKVNPWVTLLAIDLPAVLGLAVFRPVRLVEQEVTQVKKRCLFLPDLFSPLPSLPRFAVGFSTCLILLVVTASMLAFNEPQKVTSTYEVLEPETWVGKELPIHDYIDIGDQLREGNWLVLFYHYDCPDCQKTITKYIKTFSEMDINNFLVRIAFIEIPPYGPKLDCHNQLCLIGKLNNSKKWFITAPAEVLLASGSVRSSWNHKSPDFGAIGKHITMLNESSPLRFDR